MLHKLPEPMVDGVEVLHATLVLWILGSSDGRLVIHGQRSRQRHWVAQVLKHMSEEGNLPGGRLTSNILRLCGGTSNPSL